MNVSRWWVDRTTSAFCHYFSYLLMCEIMIALPKSNVFALLQVLTGKTTSPKSGGPKKWGMGMGMGIYNTLPAGVGLGINNSSASLNLAPPPVNLRNTTHWKLHFTIELDIFRICDKMIPQDLNIGAICLAYYTRMNSKCDNTTSTTVHITYITMWHPRQPLT